MATNRRTFLMGSAGALGVASTPLLQQQARAATKDKVRVAVIGTGGQGRQHVLGYANNPNVTLVAVADVDEKRRNAAAAAGKCKPVKDLRQVLDDKGVDAVSIATPDHWHTPAAILALQAGKHVYVEKPCSHNLREGELLVAAAKQHNRIVQHGTQSRSSNYLREMISRLRDGLIGEVLVAKAWNIQRRGNIGKKKPSAVPAGIDYDAWIGPAPMMPFQENRFHYNWHWWYNFGTGDAGNDGVHEIDLARWGLGIDELPRLSSAIGGKYFHDDDQQFPDTMTATFEFPGDGKFGSLRQLVFEMRLWSTNYPYNVDSGVEFLGTKGKLFLSKRGKAEWLAERNRRQEMPIKMPFRISVADHQQNFVDAIRGDAKVHADAKTAHLSAALCHLGNAATRLGKSIRLDEGRAKLAKTSDQTINAMLGREYRQHWATPLS